jgi:hypothetical protein
MTAGCGPPDRISMAQTISADVAASLRVRRLWPVPDPQPVSYVLLDDQIEGQVAVRQKNRDLFLLSLGEAVAVCANFARYKTAFTGQIRDLLTKLSEWVTARKDRIGCRPRSRRCIYAPTTR